MVVAVYPRLGELLRQRNVTVAELGQQIETRFALTFDRKVLQRLTYNEPVRRVDLDVVAAAAAVLGVGLADLFEIEANPVDESGVELSADEYRRVAELFDQRARRELSEAERDELAELVARANRLIRERLLRQSAEKSERPLEVTRAEAEADLAERIARWRERSSDAAWREALAGRTRRSPRRSAMRVVR